jgi:hypothetical protein
MDILSAFAGSHANGRRLASPQDIGLCDTDPPWQNRLAIEASA